VYVLGLTSDPLPRYRALKGAEDGSISAKDSGRYVGVLWAIVESSFVSWIGLVAFGVTDAVHWINTTPGPSRIANLEGEVRTYPRASPTRMNRDA
jgi:hypothetical protein